MNRLPRVIHVESVGSFLLRVFFDTGEHGDWAADFRDRSGPMVEPLHDSDFVAKATVDDGAVAWPNGYDAGAFRIYSELRDGKLLKRTPTLAAE